MEIEFQGSKREHGDKATWGGGGLSHIGAGEQLPSFTVLGKVSCECRGQKQYSWAEVQLFHSHPLPTFCGNAMWT